MTLFLSASEVRHLTGSRDVSKQAEWLKLHEIPFVEGLDHNLKVLVDSVFQKMGVVDSLRTTPKSDEPHWDRI